MEKPYDVIIVGAGPAGSTCAAYLSRAGVNVLLIDKETFPRDKACAGSQSEVALKHIKELGAYAEVKKAGYPSKGLMITAPDYTKCYMKAPGERFTTPRIVFDRIMKDTAIKWGAHFQDACFVNGLVYEDGRMAGVSAWRGGIGVKYRARMVIGADGAYSMIAQVLGMFPDDPFNVGLAMTAYFEEFEHEGYNEVHFDRHVLPCYVWIFPTGDRPGFANVGLGLRADLFKGTDLTKYFHRFLETSPYGSRLKRARQVSAWRYARVPSGMQASVNYAPGALLIGDAGSCALPLTGEGIGPAMESASMAADTVIEALDSNDFSEEILKRYHERWRSALRVKYQNMKVMENAFREEETINDLVRQVPYGRGIQGKSC